MCQDLTNDCCAVAMGPSIKYIMLFLANFYPLPPVTLRHTSRDPPRKYVTHLGSPFLEGLVQKTRTKALLYKFCLNCSRGFCPGGFARRSFVWKVLSGGGFCPFPLCQNTSVTSES